ncbi:hypothetical protein B0H13DRAFT_761231 [Mycena leptocephala]|nr:hypothetical protein B0H13DRAFT_761231 [Mycena leptocephala]
MHHLPASFSASPPLIWSTSLFRLLLPLSSFPPSSRSSAPIHPCPPPLPPPLPPHTYNAPVLLFFDYLFLLACVSPISMLTLLFTALPNPRPLPFPGPRVVPHLRPPPPPRPPPTAHPLPPPTTLPLRTAPPAGSTMAPPRTRARRIRNRRTRARSCLVWMLCARRRATENVKNGMIGGSGALKCKKELAACLGGLHIYPSLSSSMFLLILSLPDPRRRLEFLCRYVIRRSSTYAYAYDTCV